MNHTGCSKENLGKQKFSKYEAVDDRMELWEAQDEADEKDDGKSQVPIYFEKTLWQKLVAGLKCSQRDCREAIRATENVRRYVIEPSISRARKQSNGQL